jgi:hypothetical protein
VWPRLLDLVVGQAGQKKHLHCQIPENYLFIPIWFKIGIFASSFLKPFFIALTPGLLKIVF